MAISITSIKEKCCDSELSQFTIINGDKEVKLYNKINKSNYKSIDKVIECKDKYYLVEEKSIALGFLDRCCEEKEFDTYKSNGILNITKLIKDKIQPLDINIKKQKLQDTINDLLDSQSGKISGMTYLLNKQFDNSKTSNMPIFYLYCNSGKEIDMIINRVLQLKRTPFIECQRLKQKLQEECI